MTTAHQLADLELVDTPADEPAPRLRRELKFELSAADFRKLHHVLAVNHRAVAFAGPESLVHSVYFDDPLLSSCAESIAGVGLRTKLRLRWYDAPLPGPVAFFEVKRRRHELFEKRRFAVTAADGFAGLGYRQLVASLIPLLGGADRELLASRRMPVALVRYRRRHYRDRRPGSPVRITVDREITVFDQLGAVGPHIRFGCLLGDRIVVEIKCPPTWEASAQELLHPLRLRRTRCSKYVLACQRLGARTGAALAS